MVVVEEDGISCLDADNGLLEDDVGYVLMLVDNDAGGFVVEDSDGELPG